MKYTILPDSDIKVSKICLGSMTWGQQNSEKEGHEQIEYALEQGINFIDTAEMYSVPANKDTQGSTEKIIGSWFKKSGKRNNRKDEIGLTEIYHRENVGLFPYSPLGMGSLSGKYLKDKNAPGRLTLFPQYGRYGNPQAVKAIEKYVSVAEKHNLNPSQMALAFVNTRPFVTSTIIGATTMKQLQENIGSINVDLTEAVLKEINDIHEAIPNPAP